MQRMEQNGQKKLEELRIKQQKQSGTISEQQFGQGFSQNADGNNEYYDYGIEDEYGHERGHGGHPPVFNPMMQGAMQGANPMMGNPAMGANPAMGNGVDHNILASMMQ